MYGHNVVAVYTSRSVADSARARLIAAGIAESDIRLSAEQSGETTTARPHEPPGGFFEWLFGNVPPAHQDWYASNLRALTALSVYVRDEGYEHVLDLLEEFDPVDIDEEGLASTPTSDLAGSGVGAMQPGTARPTTATTASDEEDQVIPLSKEELSVGKRETERRYRIRTYVVERPVEEQVNLRDERVVVEHRAVADDRAVAADGVQEREFDVVERHEEPVVAKNTRATEEVVVHKDVKDRIETVRNNVRETKVDVDQDAGKLGVDRAAAGAKPGTDRFTG
jgi:stress response protein YsnF